MTEICWACNGSAEGFTPGYGCNVCGGSGELEAADPEVLEEFADDEENESEGVA